ncbi:MAG: hypothetical protein J1F04_01985 [Oscillospiraceae bacterium]|nr:hypothetical protein [Oscillospiraceae bacterium]
MDFFGTLSCIGVGGIISALLFLFSFLFSRRPTQTMLCGENVIKHSKDNNDKKEIEGESSSDAKSYGNWNMTFHVIKRPGYSNWYKAFCFSLAETCVIAILLILFYSHLPVLRAIGIGVIITAGLFGIFTLAGWFINKKYLLTESGRKKQYMIFTALTCALCGGYITALFANWGWFDFNIFNIDLSSLAEAIEPILDASMPAESFPYDSAPG